jgi:hypothetical protein
MSPVQRLTMPSRVGIVGVTTERDEPPVKIHTSLDRTDLIYAAHLAGVRFERLTQSGSRTHARKFDVILSGSSGRRASFGADHESATWDEWGIFLGCLFDHDPQARAADTYRDRDHFRWSTGNRYDNLTPDRQHRNHRWQVGARYVQTCPCGAVRRWEARQTPETQPMPLAEIFPDSISSRYESNGRYERELLADRGDFLARVDAVLAEA